MSKLTILVGVSCSGKTTWTKEQLEILNGVYRVSRDEERISLFGEYRQGTKSEENVITNIVRDKAISLLRQGYDVILDNTHLRWEYINACIRDYQEYADIEFKIFPAPTKEVMIKRNQVRFQETGVLIPENVMHKQLRAFAELIENYDDKLSLTYTKKVTKNKIEYLEKLHLEEGQEVYFTSDTHYNHKNICKGVSNWDLSNHGGDNSVRDFDSLEQMNRALIDGINNKVGQNDWLIHLGDWSFGGIENIWKFRSRVVCENIVLLAGNHDHHICRNRTLPNADGKRAQDLFRYFTSAMSLIIKHPELGSHTLEMNHYPWAVWNKAHHERIHLHGHCHASFQTEGRILDVGVDNIFRLTGKYEPVDLKFILDYMKDKTFVQKSHHNSKTN